MTCFASRFSGLYSLRLAVLLLSSPLLDPGADERIRAMPSFHDGVREGGLPPCLRVRASRVGGAHTYVYCTYVCTRLRVQQHAGMPELM